MTDRLCRTGRRFYYLITLFLKGPMVEPFEDETNRSARVGT